MGVRLKSSQQETGEGPDPAKEIWLSVSGIGDFRNCPRYYYLKRILKWTLREARLPFIVGRIANVGVHQILAGNPKWPELVEAEYKSERAKIKKERLVLSVADEEKLAVQQYAIPGMLRAYARHYAKNLRQTEHLENEKPFAVVLRTVKGVVVKMIGRIDNIVRRRGQALMHELKTSKKLTDDYVAAIKTDFQIGTYWWMNEELVRQKDPQGIPLQGIFYDVIRKPSIRQKEKETVAAYAKRLAEWYEKDGTKERNFHAETMKAPGLTKEAVFNTIHRVADDIVRMREDQSPEAFYQDFGRCHRYGRCEMYALCHEGGMTPKNMVSYKQREVVKVVDELKS